MSVLQAMKQREILSRDYGNNSEPVIVPEVQEPEPQENLLHRNFGFQAIKKKAKTRKPTNEAVKTEIETIDSRLSTPVPRSIA